jgi:hypothetical protein
VHFTLLTDLPRWVQPLAEALKGAGADCEIATHPKQVDSASRIVNRISALLGSRNPGLAAAMAEALQGWDHEGRSVVNGWHCHRIGQSKWEQFLHFQSCGVATPPTARAIPGGRALPGRTAVIKPPGGGFGRGIVTLAPDQVAASDGFGPDEGWIEQEQIHPADGWVHRVEFLGRKILYEARSPHAVGDFNYCLAKAGEEVELVDTARMPPALAASCRKVAIHGGLTLGAVEYFLDEKGAPVFFDFNPVSSLHPAAANFLGTDPAILTAEFLIAETPE